MRIHLTCPRPADTVIESEVPADLPRVLREPLNERLPHVRTVTLIRFLIVIEYTQSGVGKGVVGVKRVQRVAAKVVGSGEGALLSFVFANAINRSPELEGVFSVVNAEVIVGVET